LWDIPETFLDLFEIVESPEESQLVARTFNDKFGDNPIWVNLSHKKGKPITLLNELKFSWNGNEEPQE
jgi:hypothetical protein